MVDDNVRRLSGPGELTPTLNWYRAVNDDFYVPADRVSVPTLFIWGDQDQALGEDAALRTAGFVDAPYKFVRLKGASHWLPNERTDEIRPIRLDHVGTY